MILQSPFPYILNGENCEICDGDLFSCVKFCKKQCKTTTCKSFYKNLMDYDVIKTCPYGFAACRMNVNGRDIIITCLNVDTYSNKHDVQKRLTNSDWLPRVPIMHLRSALLSMSKTDADTKSVTEDIRDKYKDIAEQQKLLDDTIHEIRKINNQLKASSEELNEHLLKKLLEDNIIEDIRLNIFANCDLLSKRLNAYDLLTQNGLGNDTYENIHIYKKFEKIYKCLYALRNDKKIGIDLKGTSISYVRARSSLELAIFILIENAFKYSPPEKRVLVHFEETRTRLIVKVQNWGLRIPEEEKGKLVIRGYRGDTVRRHGQTEGSGLGLYLFDKICQDNKVAYQILIGNDQKNLDGWIYKPFIVQLTFTNIEFD